MTSKNSKQFGEISLFINQPQPMFPNGCVQIGIPSSSDHSLEHAIKVRDDLNRAIEFASKVKFDGGAQKDGNKSCGAAQMVVKKASAAVPGAAGTASQAGAVEKMADIKPTGDALKLENMAKVWLNDVAYLERNGHETIVVDACLIHFEHCLISGESEHLDKVLELYDPSHHSLNLTIGLMTWSNNARKKLLQRPAFVKRVVKYLHDTGKYEDGLVSGLL